MGNIYDDGLDEYVGQEATPTLPEPQTAQQPKSAELAEIEKSLELVKHIRDVQNEMRSTMSELKDMTAEANRLSGLLTKNIQEAKPIWDDLLNSFSSRMVIADESLEAYEKLMVGYSTKIINRACVGIENAIKENVAGQFSEMANKHIADFDEKVKSIEDSHHNALDGLKKEYEESIGSLEKKKGKLLAQAVEDKNRIVMPNNTFYGLSLIPLFIIIYGMACWFKFSMMPGNEEGRTMMIVSGCMTAAYFALLYWTRFLGKEGDGKSDTFGSFKSISLSQAIYIMSLTLSATVYITWQQMGGVTNPDLLLYLMPVTVGSCVLVAILKYLASGIFQK